MKKRKTILRNNSSNALILSEESTKSSPQIQEATLRYQIKIQERIIKGKRDHIQSAYGVIDKSLSDISLAEKTLEFLKGLKVDEPTSLEVKSGIFLKIKEFKDE